LSDGLSDDLPDGFSAWRACDAVADGVTVLVDDDDFPATGW
jgi:hypothetical protein